MIHDLSLAEATGETLRQSMVAENRASIDASFLSVRAAGMQVEVGSFPNFLGFLHQLLVLVGTYENLR